MKLSAAMSMEIANSWWMYLIGAVVFVFVLAGSIIFILRALKDAKKINMDKKIIRKTVKNSIIFSILPGISILFGVLALSTRIGIPLPWIRLSVIGALHYEGAAVSAAYGSLTMAEMTTQQFATISVVMTLGILTGPLFCLFGFKAYDKKALSKLKAKEETPVVEGATVAAASTGEVASEATVEVVQPTEVVAEKPKKKPFGSILFSAAFIAMISAFLAEDIARIKNVGHIGETIKDEVVTSVNTWIPLVVIVISFGVMALCDLLVKKLKWKWLQDFSLGLAMLIGMVAACLFALI